MDKKFWLILGAVVAAFVGLFILAGGKADEAQVDFEGDAAEVQSDDHIVNPDAADAETVLIEYVDFECPGCAALYPVLKQMETEFADSVTFVYRHFPLTTIHQNAFAAHRAAEAAGRQGRFFAMYDLLFSNQESWNGPSAADPVGISIETATSIFEQYAQSLELDMERYRTDFASEEVASFINKYVDSGRSLGVSSTPTLLLNGRIIPTPQSADALRQILSEAAAEALAE